MRKFPGIENGSPPAATLIHLARGEIVPFDGQAMPVLYPRHKVVWTRHPAKGEHLLGALVGNDLVTFADLPGEPPGLFARLLVIFIVVLAKVIHAAQEVISGNAAQITQLVPADGDKTALLPVVPEASVLSGCDLPVPDRFERGTA